MIVSEWIPELVWVRYELNCEKESQNCEIKKIEISFFILWQKQAAIEVYGTINFGNCKCISTKWQEKTIMLSEKQFIFEYIWVMTIKQLKDKKKKNLQIIESNVYFQSFLMDMFFSLSFCITCEK